MILTVTSLILRTAGIIFKVWLAKIIGEEGVGLYQLTFSVYVLASTFAASGICTAVTRLIAENQNAGRAAVKRIMHRSVFITLVIAAVSAIILIMGADIIAAEFLNDSRCSLSVKILAVSLPFMGVSSCLRGYFIARKSTLPPSVSQITEQIVRILITVTVISRFAHYGLAVATAAVFVGDTVAEIISCTILALTYFRDKRNIPKSGDNPRKICRKIIAISAPITAGRYITTGLKTVENIIVPTLLTGFYLKSETALALFGAIKGMAIPLIFFPSSLLMAVSTMLIPEISGAAHSAATSRKCEKVISITLCGAVLVAGCFFMAGEELSEIIYSSAQTGYIVKILAPVIPFMYLESVCDGILKGLNEQNYSFKYNVFDSALRIAAIWALVPRFGINGFLGVMIVSNIITSSLCVARVLKVGCIKIDVINTLAKPIISVALGCVAAHLASGVVQGDISQCVIKLAAVILTFTAIMVSCGGIKLPERR